MTSEEFLQTWQDWDSRPTDPFEAKAILAADIELGEQLGLSHMEVRRRLDESRRSGMSRPDALSALTAG